MKATIPIHNHFFQMMVRIAIGATVISAFIILAISFILMRKHMIDDFYRAAQNAASAYKFSIEYKSILPFDDYLERLAQHNEFSKICAYDLGNNLIAKGQVKNTTIHCPPLMINSGIQADLFTVRIAEPIEKDGKYLGMIYVEGNLSTLKSWAISGSILLTGLLLICWITCKIVAYRSAYSITTQLAVIRDQIECLKNNDIASCAIPPHTIMAEIAELSNAILALRAYLDDTKVAKSVVVDLKRWHWEMLSELLANLRHLLDADSPLLTTLSDYALLVQIERSDVIPPAKSFDIAEVLDNAISAVRKNNPISAQINLTASLDSNMAKKWIGHPEILETLLRHILLIGLKRTDSGLVCLRLQAISESRIHIAFEDSGPPIQRWHISQWLAAAEEEEMHLTDMTGDISWLLVSRLFKKLDGKITGTSNAEGGLILEGSLLMQSSIAFTNLPIQKTYQAILPTDEQSIYPLALIVVKEHGAEQKTANLFLEAGFCSFTVTTHAEALEWASMLPFSVIVLNATLSDMKESVTRRLLHMKEEGALPYIPCWVITAKHSFIESDYWRNQGVSNVLLMPLSQQNLRNLCSNLSPSNMNFYSQHDALVHSDFTPKIIELMPQIENMLASQLGQILPLIEAQAAGLKPANLIAQSHAIKSAALNIGYFRLAGLMGQIEHVAYSRYFSVQNWVVIANCLKEALKKDRMFKTLPNATPYRHNAPVDHGVLPAN